MNNKQKFATTSKVRLINGGPEMMVEKYMLDSDLQNQPTQPINAKRTLFVKVTWLEGLRQRKSVYHEKELESVNVIQTLSSVLT